MVKIIVSLLLLAIPITATTDLVNIPDQLYSEYKCMKLALHYEARGESSRGMQAVANVIMNRVNSERFPNSVCGVVYQKHRNTCQFSWHCDPRVSKREPTVGIKAKLLAFEAVVNNSLRDITGGALWFHSGEGSSWSESKQLTRQIGNHKFYR